MEACRAEKGAPIPARVVRMWSLWRYTHAYYRYVGSLTTLPCTENIIWNILGQVREMTIEQAAALIAPLDEREAVSLLDVHRSFEDDGAKVIAVSFLFGFGSPKDTP